MTEATFVGNHVWWYDILGCDITDSTCLQQWNTIHIAALIPTVGSVLCSTYIIVAGITYHRQISTLTFTAQLPIYISICDLLFELNHGSDHVHNIITGYVSEGFLCQLFGCLKPFSINCQTAWALGTAFYLSQIIRKAKEPTFGPGNILLHLVCWGVPAIVLIIGFIYGVYGIEGPWCGITSPLVDFLMVDLWMVVSYIILTLGYLYTGCYLYKIMKRFDEDDPNYDFSKKNVPKTLRTLGFYPIAYLAQWHAYALYKTAVIPQTYATALWVVSTANMGGIYNWFIYYPLLLNQVRSQKPTQEIPSRERKRSTSSKRHLMKTISVASTSQGGSRPDSPIGSRKSEATLSGFGGDTTPNVADFGREQSNSNKNNKSNDALDTPNPESPDNSRDLSDEIEINDGGSTL